MEMPAISQETAAKCRERGSVTCIKVLAMLLVVYSHSISLYMPGGWGPEAPARTSAFLGLAASWLNTLHVYAFVAVSGYLFYYLRFETRRYDNVTHVLHNKALRLLLPYACASLFWVIPFDARFWGFDALRLAKDYLLMLNPCQLWFLPMLFIVFVVFCLLCTRMRFDRFTGKPTLLFLIVLYAVNVAANLLNSFGVPNVFQWLRALQFLLFFYAGMLLRKYDLSKLFRWQYVAAAFTASVALFAVSQLLGHAGTPLSYLRIPLRPFVSLAGALFVVLLGGVIARPDGSETKLSRLLGRTMFPVYLFHQQFIYLVIVLLNRTDIAPYWLGEISFAVSLALSVLLSWLLGKWNVTKRMFSIG